MPHPRHDIASGVRWASEPIGAGAASATVALTHGVVGEGGPHALIVCGQHGDEAPWSALAVRQVLKLAAAALRGRLTVVYAANPLAVEADSRNAPLDVLDLNRTFPGRADGSHTERLADRLTALTDGVDLLIDLHGGGSWCVNAFAYAFDGSEDLAALVGAPFVVGMNITRGSLAFEAASRGARVLGIEIGGRSRAELDAVGVLAGGLTRVLRSAGVLDAAVEVADATPPIPVTDLSILRPPMGGILLPEVREDAVGTILPGGTVLGTVHDLHTLEPLHTFTAPHADTALLLLRPHVTVLEGGAMTYAVGKPAS